jgi:hypothetical protein
MERIWPSAKAQPLGAKLPAKRPIWPSSGSSGVPLPPPRWGKMPCTAMMG